MWANKPGNWLSRWAVIQTFHLAVIAHVAMRVPASVRSSRGDVAATTRIVL